MEPLEELAEVAKRVGEALQMLLPKHVKCVALLYHQEGALTTVGNVPPIDGKQIIELGLQVITRQLEALKPAPANDVENPHLDATPQKVPQKRCRYCYRVIGLGNSICTSCTKMTSTE